MTDVIETHDETHEYPACQAPQPKPDGKPLYFVRCYGKQDHDYDPEEPPYVLMDIHVSHPIPAGTKVENKGWVQRDRRPYEGDHTPPIPISMVYQWVVDNNVYYLPKIAHVLTPTPTMNVILSTPQFEQFAKDFDLLLDPDDYDEDDYGNHIKPKA